MLGAPFDLEGLDLRVGVGVAGDRSGAMHQAAAESEGEIAGLADLRGRLRLQV